MVKVKKTSKPSSLVDKASANETFVVNQMQENNEEMEDPKNSEERNENEENGDSEISEDEVPVKRMKPGPLSKKMQRKENEEKDSEISEDEVPAKRMKPGPLSKKMQRKEIKENEENDSEISEDDDPAEQIKSPPKKVQRKVKEKEEKAPANLAKVLKAKGKNKKVGAVAKTSNNSDSQPSKPPGAKEKMLGVILDGLSTMDTRKGVSFLALKKYILEEDGTSNIVSWERARPKIKAALEQGIQEELIVRPKGSENVTGLQGSFKLNKAKYTSKKSSAEKLTTKAKDSAPTKTIAKVSTSETGKRPLKTKSKEAESLPKKIVGSVKHRRSLSEETRMSEWEPKKLKKSRSMEEVPEEPKKKLKVKKKNSKKK